jgi:hypothetical protein
MAPTAVAAWILVGASAAGAATGLVRHALIVAVGFRVLTAWRLWVAAGVLWRKDAGRTGTVRMAAAGSGRAHAVVVCSAIGAGLPAGFMPGLVQACVEAQRCSPVAWATLPVGLVGLAHAGWMGWMAGRWSRVIQAGDIDTVSSA